MTISDNEIAKICNYKINTKPSSTRGVISYIEFVQDEDLKREIKRQRREQTIENILDETEEKIENLDFQDIPLYSGIPSISPIVRKVNVISYSYLSPEDIWNFSINYLDILTSQKIYATYDINSKSVKNDTKSEFYNTISRKIISSMISLSNLICMESRITPKTALIGYDMIPYFDYIRLKPSGISIGSINGIEIIPVKIKTNKIIIIAHNHNQLGVGLNIVNNINDSTFYITETLNTWTKAIKWFDVI